MADDIITLLVKYDRLFNLRLTNLKCKRLILTWQNIYVLNIRIKINTGTMI